MVHVERGMRSKQYGTFSCSWNAISIALSHKPFQGRARISSSHRFGWNTVLRLGMQAGIGCSGSVATEHQALLQAWEMNACMCEAWVAASIQCLGNHRRAESQLETNQACTRASWVVKHRAHTFHLPRCTPCGASTRSSQQVNER